jgi:P4 family phage/plasmid primase-like protien
MTEIVTKFKELFKNDRAIVKLLKSKITMEKQCKFGYCWNEKTLIHDVLSLEELNGVIMEIVDKILKKEYKKTLDMLRPTPEIMINVVKLYETYSTKYGNSKTIEGVIKACGSLIRKFEYNSDMNLLPIKNGNVIDLRTLEIKKRTFEDKFTYFLNVEYTKDIPQAEKYFKSLVMDDDINSYLRLQEILGYSISRWTFLQKYFVFWGEASNGKSMLFKILEMIFGDLITTISESIFKNAKYINLNGPTPDIMQLQNKHLGYYTESSHDELNDETIKKISGEDKISGRKMRSEMESILLCCKLILSGNNRPSWKVDAAMKRRLEMMVFVIKFTDEVKNANERKKDMNFINNIDLNQIFSWIVLGSKRIYETKIFTTSKICDDETNNYLSENNTTESFIKNIIVQDSKNKMLKSQLFDGYITWCKNNKIKCEQYGLFIKQIEKIYPAKDTHGTYFFNIRLKNYNQNFDCYEYNRDIEHENVILENEKDTIIKNKDEIIKTKDETIENLKKKLEITNFLMKMNENIEISDEKNKAQKEEFDKLVKKHDEMEKIKNFKLLDIKLNNLNKKMINEINNTINNMFKEHENKNNEITEDVKNCTDSNNPINEMFKEIEELKKMKDAQKKPETKKEENKYMTDEEMTRAVFGKQENVKIIDNIQNLKNIEVKGIEIYDEIELF